MYEFEYTKDGKVNIYKTVDEVKTLVFEQPNFESEDDATEYAKDIIRSMQAADAIDEQLLAKRLEAEKEQVDS